MAKRDDQRFTWAVRLGLMRFSGGFVAGSGIYMALGGDRNGLIVAAIGLFMLAQAMTTHD